jgi:transposase-like protein
VPTLFKKCPSCGKRFEVEHTGESVDKKMETVTEEKMASTTSLMAANSGVPLPDAPARIPPTTTVTETIEEDVYTESYRCKHCGHVWTEEHEVVEDVR